MIKCPNCGAENEDSAQACVQCQAALGEQAPATEAPAAPPPAAPAPAAPPPAAPYGAPPQQQPYQQAPQYPGYGPQPVPRGPVIPPGVITGLVLAIVGMVMVLVGMSISWYRIPLNAWDGIAWDAQFAYIIVVVIFAILAMVFSIIIWWVRQPAFLQIIRATGILGIVLPIVMWLHGFAYGASYYDVDFGVAFDNMGFGFGWIVALIGGVFFIIAAQMIKKDVPFVPRAPTPPAQPGYYQQPAYQQPPEQPPQQPPQPPPGTP